MSTSPYSKDLRKKVVEFIQAGIVKQEACKIFKLNKSTMDQKFS
ncbi:hypothetical protein NOVO_08190 [Rickettsiales bacterium Ac37b]|nr:hypothetical protein NOVO_08190 [Rickettsiales bacterium Ac37b]